MLHVVKYFVNFLIKWNKQLEENLKYRKFNAKWALETNELLDIFKGMRVLRYQDYDDAREAYSSIIAQKP